MIKSASDLASALGKLARGVKKTMTPDAIEQRRNAAKASAKARKKTKKRVASGNGFVKVSANARADRRTKRKA